MKNESIPLDVNIGKLTSEADIRYGLNHEERPKKLSMGERFKKGGKSKDDGGRRLKPDFSEIEDENQVITYHPVQFEKSWTPGKEEEFI